MTTLSTEAIAGIAMTAGAFLLRLALRVARDARTRRTAAVLARAGAVASAHAAGILRAKVRAAQAPDSPGGVTVTAEELRSAVRDSVEAGRADLASQDVPDKVIAALGGADAITESLLSAVENSLKDKGYPVGSAPQKQ